MFKELKRKRIERKINALQPYINELYSILERAGYFDSRKWDKLKDRSIHASYRQSIETFNKLKKDLKKA